MAERTISFVVPGLPIAQVRPQPAAAVIAGKMRGVMRNAPKEHPVHVWRALVAKMAWEASEAQGAAESLTGPLSASLEFLLPRPRSHYRTGKHAGELKAGAPYWVAKKPDADNLQKAATDAMEGILYANDSQIAALKVTKRYAPEGVQPQARIGLATLEESP